MTTTETIDRRTALRELLDSWDGPVGTMLEAYERREELARVTDDPWMQAHTLTTRRIVEHPLFRKLVREIAVAEQPKGPPTRLRLNSPTYGSWWTRGMGRLRATRRAGPVPTAGTAAPAYSRRRSRTTSTSSPARLRAKGRPRRTSRPASGSASARSRHERRR